MWCSQYALRSGARRRTRGGVALTCFDLLPPVTAIRGPSPARVNKRKKTEAAPTVTSLQLALLQRALAMHQGPLRVFGQRRFAQFAQDVALLDG